MANTLNSVQEDEVSVPWWKSGYVWMLMAGPAIVVVAGCYTFWLAASEPDAVIDENYYQKGLELSKPEGQRSADMTPAVKGRNHAVTPAGDKPE